jgi:hypothetical protein
MASSRRGPRPPTHPTPTLHPPHPVLGSWPDYSRGSTPAAPAPEHRLSLPVSPPPPLGAAEGVYVFGVLCVKPYGHSHSRIKPV